MTVPPNPAAVPAVRSLVRPVLAPFPGVPAPWCDGVTRLAARAPPDGIKPARWAALASASVYLVRQHGAALHAAGWDALDLFGLHPFVPAAWPDCMGLAWLLDGRALASVTPEAALIIAHGGHRLRARRMGTQARRLAALAWDLGRKKS